MTSKDQPCRSRQAPLSTFSDSDSLFYYQGIFANVIVAMRHVGNGQAVDVDLHYGWRQKAGTLHGPSPGAFESALCHCHVVATA